ncbi:hypothetical protein QVD17_20703 [Tagetes erecta]|uniref:VQ domain-containing protein n=1 Tax=Tagetes erecta TaxID=13708 RepID=A0AAD8KS59_TARER|nr:hypothetical protein QVD17_20703 [Tagetes erecta]
MDTRMDKPTKNYGKRRDNKKLKVVYISSPIKVKTSVSRFRSLVQELTGRDSDITRYNVGCFDTIAPTTNTRGGSSSSLDRGVKSKPVEFTQEGVFTGSDSCFDNVLSSDMFDQLDDIFQYTG